MKLCLFFILFYFILVFLPLLGPLPQHIEVPRLGVSLELRLPAYTTATATQDPSHVCNLHSNAGSLTQGSNPQSHGSSSDSLTTEPRWELLKLCFCEAVQHGREDFGFCGLMDLVSEAVPPLPGCVTLHRCLHLSEPQFPHLIGRNNSPYLKLGRGFKAANLAHWNSTFLRHHLNDVKTILEFPGGSAG